MSDFESTNPRKAEPKGAEQARLEEQKCLEEQEIQEVLDSQPEFGTYSSKAKQVMSDFESTNPRKAEPKGAEQERVEEQKCLEEQEIQEVLDSQPEFGTYSS